MTDGRTSWGNDGLRTFNAAPQTPLFDPELGQIFIKMRTLLGVSLWDMAVAIWPVHPGIVLAILILLALYFLYKKNFIPAIEFV